MTDLPILFSAPMIRALLSGTKTQTRRVIKGVPEKPTDDCHPSHKPRHAAPYLGAYCFQRKTPENPRGMGNEWCWWQVDDRQCLPIFKVPYRPGDRMWCRETYTATQHDKAVYRADARDQAGARWSSISVGDPLGEVKWKPSIFMPRRYSRLTLYVTDVRVERLQDITLGDICAEGLAASIYDFRPVQRGFDAWISLWDSINGAGSWDANPWVAAYTFVPRLGNIDTLPSTLEEVA